MTHLIRHLSIRFRFVLLCIFFLLLLISLISFIYFTFKTLGSLDSQTRILIQGQLELFNILSIVITLGIIVFSVLGLFFILFFMKSIVTPLDNLFSSISTFQIGKSFVLPVEDTADGLSDEIAILSRSLSHFLNNLSQTYSGMELRVSQRTEALTQRALHLQAAAELARDTTSISDTDDLLNRAVNLIKDRFGLYFVGIYLVDSDSELALIRAGTGNAGKTLIAQNHFVRIGEIGLIGFVAGSGELKIVNDTQKDFVYKQNLHLSDTRAQAVFPLKIGSEIIGVLDTHSMKEDFFDTGITSVLQIMADQLTVAIQNASLVSDLQSRINEARLLYQRYAHDSWSRNRLGDLSRGYQYDVLGISYADESLSPVVLEELREGKPFVINLEDGDKSVLYMPLMMFNQVIGYIGLEDSSYEREWTEDDITVLETITNQISLALDNSRLLEETQLRVDQINLLQEVTAIAAAKANLVELLISVAKRIQEKLHLDYCNVFWFDPDGLSAVILNESETQKTTPPISFETRFPVVDNPLIQQIIETERSIDLYDLLHNPLVVDFRSLIEERNLFSLLITPLFLKGEVNGFLMLQVSDKEYRFSIDDVRLMDQVSLQISSALEVARSFEETTDRAERERKIGEVTQRIRETLDVQTILFTATNELRQVLKVPEVTIRITQDLNEMDDENQEAELSEDN